VYAFEVKFAVVIASCAAVAVEVAVTADVQRAEAAPAPIPIMATTAPAMMPRSTERRGAVITGLR
jgi:hypothetical protein